MSVATEKAKEQVAKIGLRMANTGLVTGPWGNVSVRIPKDNLFVITPSGMPYNMLLPKDMIVMNMSGEVVEGELPPSTEYAMHLEILKARPDVNAVMHTHSLFAGVLSVSRKPIPLILEELAQVVGKEVPVADYARAGTPELAKIAADTLGDGGAVLLANHGAVGVGRSLNEALVVCQVVEKAAQTFIWAELLGKPVVISSEDAAVLRYKYLTSYGNFIARICQDGTQRRSKGDKNV